MVGYVELYMDQGADFGATLNITDDVTHLPEDLEMSTVTCQLRKSFLSSNASANLKCSVYDPDSGIIFISLDAANTSNLKAGTYVFDVKLNVGPFLTIRLIEGTIRVTPSITR